MNDEYLKGPMFSPYNGAQSLLQNNQLDSQLKIRR